MKPFSAETDIVLRFFVLELAFLALYSDRQPVRSQAEHDATVGEKGRTQQPIERCAAEGS